MLLSRPGRSSKGAYSTLYWRICPRIPSAYLVALAALESNTNPREASGPAWGLLQVVESVRESYNKRFGTSYTRNDLLDPEINVKIACELLTRIANLFSGTKYRRAFPGGFDWQDSRHVALLTFAWNAGWSPSRGVAGVILHLIDRGLSASQITIDSVQQAAAGLSYIAGTVARSDKVAWCKSVVARYEKERNQ